MNAKDIRYHKFPDEIPEDFQTVLTVAVNPITGERIYHTFTFGEKSTLEVLLKHKHQLSLVFIGWCADRNYEVTAWCEIPEYEELNVSTL